MKIERGLALQDLITGAYDYVETIDFPPQARVYLLDQMAITEYVIFDHTLIITLKLRPDIGFRLAEARRYS